MRDLVRIHYDNKREFVEPVMWVWVTDGATLEKEVTPSGKEDFGFYFDLEYNRSSFDFCFKDGKGSATAWEEASSNRHYDRYLGSEIWTKADRHNLYNVLPAEPVGNAGTYYDSIKPLIINENYYIPDTDVSGLQIPSMLGANILKDGSLLFGFFHPRAARVYLTGSFNDFQCPGHPNPQTEQFIEMELYRGFYYEPNLWLARVFPKEPLEKIQYKFYVQGGLGGGVTAGYVTDPYTRVFSDDFSYRNSMVVDPTHFKWTDTGWRTPAINELILYELNIYGFTDNDPEIPPEIQGTFKGVTHRIKHNYFNNLGVTVIALMPTAEVPRKQGLGYEPCTFMAVEKDFGTPDDFREMVNEAHNRGLTVIIDQVFNHTSNDFNPLWELIDDNSGDGGYYFEGKTMWGNKVATGKDEVDNMLIDSCKLFIKEYHVDGFRFDATHSYFLNHKLLHQLAHEIKDRGFKPDAIMIAENLPNESDINLDGYNGYAQWSNLFHDKLKALLREGTFEGSENNTDQLGSTFYFSKDSFAAHTNNVVNFCESHDENSVQYEVGTGGANLQDPELKRRKARLGLMSTMVALGQPMIYMGQEYGIERERNRIDVEWIKYHETNQFYHWAKGLINLRHRLPGLKLSGYNPAADGLFTWVIGPWLEANRGNNRKVIGWRTGDQGVPQERLMVLLNFEGTDIPVDLSFNTSGRWVKLADIERVNDTWPVPMEDLNLENGKSIDTDGEFKNFVLPAYSGFIYQYMAADTL